MTPSAPSLDAAMAEAGLVPGKSPSPVMLPDPSLLFMRRAARLRILARGNSLADWLMFVADLAEAQHKVANGARTAEYGPDRQWLVDLTVLTAALDGELPPAARQALDWQAKADEAAVEQVGDRIRAGLATAADLAVAPFLAAARQLAWTRHAAAQDVDALTPGALAHKCPVCGEAPTAGMIHAGAQVAGLRYLHCGTCGTAWHHVRASCVACGEGAELSYRHIEGGSDGVRAECCDSCKSTLKLFVAETCFGCEPVADDLATLALDILVGEEGYRRIGGNPFLAMAADG